MIDTESTLVYLNRQQHNLFKVDYMAYEEHLVICAKTLLDSNVEYDQVHQSILVPYRNKTIQLFRKNLPPGWFRIKEL